MTADDPPQVVVAVHMPLLAEALTRVLQRGLVLPRQGEPPGSAVQVVTLDCGPDPQAVHVLRLPETVGDPAVLESPGASVSLVLWSLEDIASLVDDLLARG